MGDKIMEDKISIDLPMPSRSSSGYNSNTSEDADGLLESGSLVEIEGDKMDAVLSAEAMSRESPGEGLEMVMEPGRLVGVPVMEQVLESGYPIDIVVSCSDGKVGGHRVVLVAASPFLKYVLKDHRLGEVATLILPDISVQVMTLIMQLCYTGRVVFPPELVDEINDGMEYLMIGAGARGEFSLKKVLVKLEVEERPAVAGSSQGSGGGLPPVKVDETPNNPSQEENESESESESEEAGKEIIENPNLKHIARAVLRSDADGDGDCYHCTTCDLKLLRRSFQNHLKGQHDQEMGWKAPSPQELSALTFCPVCNIHFPSILAADECLKKHDLTRCYTCLAIFKYDGWASHYKTAHGIKSKYGWVARCRWCDLAVFIGNTGQLLRKHARFTHFSKVGYPKKFKTVQSINTDPAASTQNNIQTPQSSSSSPENGKTRSRSRSRTSETSITAAATANVKNLPRSKKGLAPLRPGRRSSSRITASATTEVPCPYFETFTENLAKRRACRDTSGPESNADQPPAKKRRLDVDGNPLQLAKRTGRPVGKQKVKFLSSDMKFNRGAFPLEKDLATGQISNQQINGLPPVHVHIDLLPEPCLNSEYSEDRGSQNLLLAPTAPESQQSKLLTIIEIDLTEPPFMPSTTEISEADTQLIHDPFEATKTVRLE